MILSLPKSITSIIINGMHYEPVEYLLTQLFPLSARESYHEEMYAIEPSFDIDEPMFAKIVAYLQNHPSPINYLVYGLLLHIKINNTYNEDRDNLPQYLENRVMAAISFYCKAACDAELKPKIESILWHLRTTEYENERIQCALKPYKLSPLAFAPTYAAFRQDTPLSPWFILKMGLSISLGAAAIGTTIISMLTYAACRFFVNVERSNADWPSNLELQSAVFS